jgi:hypothetical protein
MNERLYSCSDLAMILASRVIAKNLSDYLSELSNARTTWTADFITRLLGNIEDVSNNLVGKRSTTSLFKATAELEEIMAPARKDISSLKVQIDTDFKKDEKLHKIILDELGYTSNFKSLNSRNQGALIALLTLFTRNIDKYKADMITKGTPPSLIDRLAGYGEVVRDANTIQEQLKSSGKNATAQTVNELNGLYDQISSICKIAADYYKANATMKEMFTFSKIVSNLGTAKPAKKVKEAAKS